MIKKISKRIILPTLFFCLLGVSDNIALLSASEGAGFKIDLSNIQSFKTGNGIQTLYIRDELPQFTIFASIGYGKLYEKRENAGISDLLARSLSMGGSKNYPANALYEAIESIGGKLSINSSWEETTISIKVLERHAELAVTILADLLLYPAFTEKHITHARSLLGESVRRKRDQPLSTAFDKAREIVFDGNGYGATIREETLNALGKKDILAVWKKYFTAGNMIVGISSSVSLARVKKIMSKLNGLKGGKRLYYPVQAASLKKKRKEKSTRIYLIPKDLPQATVVLATVAPPITDPAIYSLRVMNYILGGGSFNSRLMREIRVKRGLAYSVQSIMRMRKNAGAFFAYAQTKTEKVDITLSLIRSNIEQMFREYVTGEELEWAQESMGNSYIFKFDTPMSILSRVAALEYNQLEKVFLLDYIRNIKSVSREDIRKNCRDLFGAGLVTVVVGKRTLVKKLKRFGTVIIVEDK